DFQCLFPADGGAVVKSNVSLLQFLQKNRVDIVHNQHVGRECCHSRSDISFVNEMKSATESRSALRSYSGLSPMRSFGTRAASAFRRVLRRWLKAALTTRVNSVSSQSSSSVALRVNRITPESTFGGGLKAPAFTVNRYSAW